MSAVAVIGIALGTLTMESLQGAQVLLDNYGERPGTVLVFLSSRCPATLEAIESINEYYETAREREILFVGLCANDAEESEELRPSAEAVVHGVRVTLGIGA